ncbi:HEAT repeat domain-containing protein [Paenibacillus harenae]|uniref:HEAT repeat domain-containing protein n=1 Tax=Paenibacillus harenae TaxID=306543 RepID=A0ABT9TVB3_PAEHA|nr:HEAT repeat domain-containing protein [Paenibacillus harenae]MDQ0111288.1 hypothetical protein [Paenibacillus harenae]
MSIPLLRELHEDMRRLFIAGASLAPNDLRLEAMLPKLERLGEAAPVFKKVAETVSGVLGASPDQAATKLLDLSVLLHAILHTQGSAEAAGELRPIGLKDTLETAPTAISYRKLQPVIDALTNSGSGRLEAIRQANADGLFADMRTVVPAVAALEDTYSEIAEYVAEEVLPKIGQRALPVLHASFDLQGGSGDARKLTAIYRLTSKEETAAAKELVRKAAFEGSQPVRIAAIRLAANDSDFEEKLLELSQDRKKEIRSAALLALSDSDSEQALERLMEALVKKDTAIAAEPIRRSGNPKLKERVLAFGEELLGAMAADGKSVSWLERMLAVLGGLRSPDEHAAERDFLMRLLNDDAIDVTETSRIQSEAAEALLESGHPQALAFLHELRHKRPNLLAYSFKAAIRLEQPADAYEAYRPYLDDRKGPAAKQLLQVFHEWVPGPLHELRHSLENVQQSEPSIVWDDRWVHRFVKMNEEDLVARLAVKPDKEVVDYLLNKANVKSNIATYRTTTILLALVRLGHEDASELIMSTIEKARPKQIYYFEEETNLLIASLPRRYADRIRLVEDRFYYEEARNKLLELADLVAAKAEEDTTKGAGLLSWIKSKVR